MDRMASSDPSTDLVRQAQARDGAAFTRLVHQHYSLALGYACALLRDVHHAEDATQEAFAEAYASLPRLEDPAVQVLVPKSEDPGILETGIKAVDLLCPIGAGLSLAQVGVSGVGRIVLLEELRLILKKGDVPLHVFGLVAPSDVSDYRDWPPEGALQDRVGALATYWVVAHRGTDPDFEGLGAFDAIHYLTPLLAVQALYPAIDPEYSSSRLLTEAVAGRAHVELAARARTLLTEAKRRFCPPAALELLACSARRTAARVAAAYQPEIAEADAVRLGRARRLQLFLTQPFFTAAENGGPGRSVSLRDTLEGCRAILDGEVDDLPVEAFRYAGTLDEVRERSERGRSG